jgi:hypothetical protein
VTVFRAEGSQNNQNLLNHMHNEYSLNQMEEFNFNPDLESELSRDSEPPNESESSSRTGRYVKRGRPPNKISENSSNDNSSSQLSKS